LRQHPRLLPAVLRLKVIASALIVTMLCGCAGSGWGARTGFPDSWQAIGESARAAAVQPSVWVPLGGAIVLGVADLDDNISEWAVREQPLFGSNAADVSDDLLDASLGVWALSVVLAPADSTGHKLRGAATQAGSILLTGGISEGLKSITSRRRPNDENNNSLPSGHASQAAVRTHFARTNLNYFDLPKGARRASNVALHTLDYATAWARVEANRHFPSDVLAGVALGNFVAEFMRGILFEANPERAAHLQNQVQVQMLPGGAVLHFSAPLR